MKLLAGIFLCFTAFVAIATSKPVDDILGSNDSETTGSDVKNVYAPAPFDDLVEAGTEHKKHHSTHHKSHSDDGDSGYYTSKSSKGDKGYKHFDSFHKKEGDKYGFEKHSSFGKEKKGGDGGKHHKSGSYHKFDGDDGAESHSDGGEFQKLFLRKK